MPLGDLKIEFGHEFREKSYRRSLDLSRSVCAVEYETPDGVRFEREMFVSAPDQALIVALRASEKGALGFTASLNTQLRGARNRKRNPSGCTMPVAREAGIPA